MKKQYIEEVDWKKWGKRLGALAAIGGAGAGLYAAGKGGYLGTAAQGIANKVGGYARGAGEQVRELPATIANRGMEDRVNVTDTTPEKPSLSADQKTFPTPESPYTQTPTAETIKAAAEKKKTPEVTTGQETATKEEPVSSETKKPTNEEIKKAAQRRQQTYRSSGGTVA